MKKMRCGKSLVQESLLRIRAAGKADRETVVLWLGRGSESEGWVITECYHPRHFAEYDYFKIPAESMRELMRYLREKKLKLIAQVHSHPKEAFHSAADDAWAIVRYEGALSLVVPHFGGRTDAESFLDDIAVYKLAKDDSWLKANPRSELEVSDD